MIDSYAENEDNVYGLDDLIREPPVEVDHEPTWNKASLIPVVV
jgi:hypothetical protein